MATVRISGAFAVLVLSGLSFSSSAFAAQPPKLGCTPIEIVQAKALANKAIELSKTDSAAALAIAENVAKNNKSCFQVAFGAVLDGTGTASVGSPLSGVLRSGETTERGNGETPGSDDHPLVGSAG